MSDVPRGRVRRRTTPVDLAALASALTVFEDRYGVPSARMTEAPEFRDAGGNLQETDDLTAWSSTYARYKSLTQHH